MKNFMIPLILLVLSANIILTAQDNLNINSSNHNVYDIIFHNPAGIPFNKEIQFSLGTQLLWTGISGDHLRRDYLSYAHPINLTTAIGIRGNYFSSNLMYQGTISLLLSRKIYQNKLSIGINANYIFYSYNQDKFKLIDAGDPLLEKGNSLNVFSFGLGMIYQPNPTVSFGASIDHINQPDISLEKSGIKKGLDIKLGTYVNIEPIKPQIDLKIEEGDLLIQGGIRKTFYNENLNFFLGYDFITSDKSDLLLETSFYTGTFGFCYNFQYSFTELNSISSGCHRFNCIFKILLPEKSPVMKKMEKLPIVSPIRGQKWAVIIGISNYKDTRIKRLNYATQDAKFFYNWLISPEGGNYSKDRIKLLLDEEATLTNITTALRNWLKNPIAEDMVTIYFASHGAPENPYEKKNYYLLTYDTDLDNIEATAFPMWHIEDALKRHIKAKQVVIIADVCHAGGISDEFYDQSRSIEINAHNINQTIESFSTINAGICILNASSKDQLSQEGEQWGGGHGVFTYYLLEGLKGKADQNVDHKVTLGEVSNFVSETVRRATKNAQTPTVAGSYDPQLTIKNEE